MEKFYHITTYGCQMNVHESEKLAGIMEDLGYSQNDDINKSDVILFNTCCIREHAEQRAYGNIGALKGLKRKRPDIIIGVCGCMPQQDGVAIKLKQKFPFVDIIFGTHNLHTLKDLIIQYEDNKKAIKSVWNTEGDIAEGVATYRTSGVNGWVNITYGCNNFCTYCIVPYVRGRERSRDIAAVLNEIKELIALGYKEITLLGQNVNSYGNDLTDGSCFAKLLEEIGKLDGKFRLRFMTSHPKDLSVDVIKAIAKYDNICKSIHLPVQSGSNSILKIMNRKYTREDYFSLVEMIRENINDVQLTTDIMVGFPGETDEDYNDTLDLIQRVKFSNAFTFIYSRRSGTAADKMENQIAEEVKKKRIQELISIQNKISKQISVGYINKIMEVLCEGRDKKDKSILIGRTDCGRLVAFKGDDSNIGKFLNIKITSANAASLKGEIV